MQINKKLFWFSLIVSIVLIVISSIIEFSTDMQIFKFVENILLNIFAGTIVLIATSIFEYNVQKRRNIIAIQEKIIDFENIFIKLEYMEDIDEYPTYEQCCNYYASLEPPRTYTKKQYENDKRIDMGLKYKKKFESIIEQYINISDINLNELWRLYDDLYFLWPIFGKDKKKLKIYNEVFEYIDNLVCKIKESAYHFKLYKNSSVTNYKPSYNILLKLQKNVFYHEKTYGYVTDWLDSHNKEYLKEKVKNPIDDSYTLEYNIVGEYLDKKWKEIGKL